MLKNKNREGFIDLQRKGGRVGLFIFSFSLSALFLALYARSCARPRSLADVFEKKENKNRTTSVYRLRLRRRVLYARLLLERVSEIYSIQAHYHK